MKTARIEAFSDGVFAIAITLLVVDVHDPDSDLDGLWQAFDDELGRWFPVFEDGVPPKDPPPTYKMLRLRPCGGPARGRSLQHDTVLVTEYSG